MAQQRGNFIYSRRVVHAVLENALTHHQVAALTGHSDVDIDGGNIQTCQCTERGENDTLNQNTLVWYSLLYILGSS